MCFDPVIPSKIHRPRSEVIFHDPEGFFYFPSSMVYFQDCADVIIEIGLDSIETIILCLLINSCLIQFICDFYIFSFLVGSFLADKTSIIMRIFLFEF